MNKLDREIGMKLMPLNETDDPDHDTKKDAIKDVKVFQEVFKKTFFDIKKKHRDVVGDVRTREFDTFS